MFLQLSVSILDLLNQYLHYLFLILSLFLYPLEHLKMKIDDVLGVWPLHGLAGAWGGIAAGIFGLESLGGLGGVSLMSQILGTLMGIGIAIIAGGIIYGGLKLMVGIRLHEEDEYRGADLAIHKIAAEPETSML